MAMHRDTPSPTYRYWIWSPEDGMRFYATADARDADAALSVHAACEDGWWHAAIDALCAGEVQLLATQVGRRDRPPPEALDDEEYDMDGICRAEGYEYTCDYQLLPLPQALREVD